MANERFCAEPGCEREVVERHETKCGIHRVNVGDNVVLNVAVRDPKTDEFCVSIGTVSKIDGGSVSVDFPGDYVKNVVLSSRLFSERGESGWVLTARI